MFNRSKLFKHTSLIISLLLSSCNSTTEALNNSSLSATNFKRPYPIDEMVRDFISRDNPHHDVIEMNIRTFDNYDNLGKAVFLYAEITNHTDEAICIPEMFFRYNSIMPNTDILSLYDARGEPIPYDDSLELRMFWPRTEFVIIYPNRTEIKAINLTISFQLDEKIRMITVKYSVPAFLCSAMRDGYPISEEMAANRPFGLDPRQPVVPVSREAIIVYQGVEQFSLRDD